jgi:hypothetical protein
MSARRRAAVLAENSYHELDFWYPVLRLGESGLVAAICHAG